MLYIILKDHANFYADCSIDGAVTAINLKKKHPLSMLNDLELPKMLLIIYLVTGLLNT